MLYVLDLYGPNSALPKNVGLFLEDAYCFDHVLQLFYYPDHKISFIFLVTTLETIYTNSDRIVPIWCVPGSSVL